MHICDRYMSIVYFKHVKLISFTDLFGKTELNLVKCLFFKYIL